MSKYSVVSMWEGLVRVVLVQNGGKCLAVVEVLKKIVTE
jgi:hypothetical protein